MTRTRLYEQHKYKSDFFQRERPQEPRHYTSVQTLGVARLSLMMQALFKTQKRKSEQGRRSTAHFQQVLRGESHGQGSRYTPWDRPG